MGDSLVFGCCPIERFQALRRGRSRCIVVWLLSEIPNDIFEVVEGLANDVGGYDDNDLGPGSLVGIRADDAAEERELSWSGIAGKRFIDLVFNDRGDL